MPNTAITKDQAVNNLDLLRIVVSEVVDLDILDYGICPFHNEAARSFNIFKAKSGRARYHCFGCNTTGDIFNFLASTKQLNFKSSIEFISKLIDRPIISPSEESENSTSQSQFQSLLDSKDQNQFCEKDCPKYAALRDDYEAILAERYSEAGVEINPDLNTIPALVDKIGWLENQIKVLEDELKEYKRKSNGGLGGFGSPAMK